VRCSRAALAASLTAVVAVAALATADRPRADRPAGDIEGPYARLLAEATDLGPARDPRIQLTAALRDSGEPVRLARWADLHGLSVRWREGDAWAIVEGSPDAVADALGIAVHD